MLNYIQRGWKGHRCETTSPVKSTLGMSGPGPSLPFHHSPSHDVIPQTEVPAREALTSLTATSALTWEASTGSRPGLCGISNDRLNGPLGIQPLVSKTDEPDVHQRHRSFCFRNPLRSRKAPWEHLNPQGLFRAHEVSQGCQRVRSLGNCCRGYWPERDRQELARRDWPFTSSQDHH